MDSLDTETPEEEIAPEEENDDSATVVDIGATGPVLTTVFSQDKLDEIGAQVCDDFEADCESCEEHLKRCARWNEMYSSVMRSKSWPFEGAANVNVPVLTTTVLQIHGRMLDMMIPAKGNIYNCVPVRDEDELIDQANRCEIQANHWARHDCTEFMSTYEAVGWRLIIYGSSFLFMDWDDEEQRPTIRCVPIEDMVVPYNARPERPDMKNVPRYTHVDRMSYWDIQADMDRQFFVEVPEIKPGATPAEETNPIAAVREKIDGLSEGTSLGTTEEDGLRKVLIHYRKLVLSSEDGNHESFDDRAHPVRIWVDFETRKVLRIVLREMPDPKDAMRFQQENQAYLNYTSLKADWDASGGVTVDPMTQMPMHVPPPEEVPMPKPQRTTEVTFFTHYRAFNSEGFYGLGYGDIVGPLNAAMNTIVNQRLDLMTLNNAGGGWKSRVIKFPAGPHIIRPGQYIDVDAPPSALKEGIVQRPIIPGDPATPMFLEKLDSWYQRATGSGDTLSGEPSKSNETATAATARYDAANKQISILASRVVTSYMKNDVDMLWRLFSTYLPDGEYRHLLSATGKAQTVFTAREDFSWGSRVFPVSDPRVMTKQDRINSANSFMTAITQNPLLARNPQVMYEATKKWLIANDMHEVVEMIPKPHPPQPPPPKPQVEENADFLTGKNPPVNPVDNDEEHLAEIATFKNSPEAMALTPEMSNALDQHARNHTAAKMKKDLKNGQAAQQGGLQGMATIGSNQGTGLVSQ